MTTKITIVYHSAFKGSTQRLAEAAARGAGRVADTDIALLRVEDIVERHWGRLNQSDALIFGSPTYVGCVSAVFKAFIERCAGEVWLKRYWVNKVAGGFTVSAGRSGDKLNCLQDLVTFACQMGMIWVPVRITGGNYSTQGSEQDLNRMAGYLGVMAQANIDEPPDLAPPPSDILTTEMHGEHVARVARQYRLGRQQLRSDYDTYADNPNIDSRPLSLAELGG
jgi:multimeric flavodoxin WrbA